MKRLLIPVFVSVALVSGGCLTTATKLPPIQPTVVKVDETVKDVADYALTVLEQVADKALAAKDMYLSAKRLGVVPASLDANVRREFTRLADLGLYAIQKIREGVTTWDRILELIRPVIAISDSLTSMAAQVQQHTNEPATWKGMVTGFALKALSSWVESKIGGVQ
jgi:hypothetical protein